MNNPYDRLRQFQQPMQQPVSPVAQGLQMTWMPNIGGEAEGQNDTQGYGNLSSALDAYLKKRHAERTQGRMGDAPMGPPGNVV